MNKNERIYVEKIKQLYIEKGITKLEQLKQLDKKAKKPAKIFSIVFGILSSLVFAFGLSVSLGILFRNQFWIGIFIGLIGIIMILINYKIHKKIMNFNKNKYADEIIKISNELMGG